MTPRSVGVILEAACVSAGLSHEDLWIGYYSLGGHASPAAVEAFLAGTAVPARADYDLLAQALNDRFIQQAMDHPVPYAEDLAPFPGEELV